MAYDDRPRISVSISRRVNLGEYNSADVMMCVSNIDFEANEAEIQRALSTQNLAFSMLAIEMRERIARVRMEGGFELPSPMNMTEYGKSLMQNRGWESPGFADWRKEYVAACKQLNLEPYSTLAEAIGKGANTTSQILAFAQIGQKELATA